MLPRTYQGLTRQQIGAVCEDLARAAFVLKGFEVYRTEYDDRGIDFVARKPNGSFYKVQVKGTGPTVQPFISKGSFHLTDDFLFVAIRLIEGTEAMMYVARGSTWQNPQGCIRHNPGGGIAGPYYEFSFAQQYEQQLATFLFDTYAGTL